MAGKITTNSVVLGDSVTDTQNFVLKTNADGTATLARGALGGLGTVFGVNGSGALTGATLVAPALGTVASGVISACTSTNMVLVTPALGTPTALVGTNISGTSTTFSAGFGVNQTYTSPTRVVSTNYTNSGTKPLFVTVMGSAGNPVIIIDGVSIQSTTSGQRTCQAVIPPGSVYSVTLGNSVISWTEMGV